MRISRCLIPDIGESHAYNSLVLVDRFNPESAAIAPLAVKNRDNNAALKVNLHCRSIYCVSLQSQMFEPGCLPVCGRLDPVIALLQYMAVIARKHGQRELAALMSDRSDGAFDCSTGTASKSRQEVGINLMTCPFSRAARSLQNLPLIGDSRHTDSTAPPPGRPTSTAGCLCRVRPGRFVYRWFVESLTGRQPAPYSWQVSNRSVMHPAM